MRDIRLTAQARADIDHAHGWYESEKPGLGAEFESSLHLLLERVARQPLAFPVLSGTLRRAIVKRFPYIVIFRAQDDEPVVVHAVFHTAGNPRRLRERLRNQE
jgi:plasmid stabilization system protein ParE